MASSILVYMMVSALVFGLAAAQSPLTAPVPAPAHPLTSSPTIPPAANAPTAHPPRTAHAPSPMKTPPPLAATPSPVVHLAPTKSPLVANPPSSISIPPSVAPAPAKSAAVFYRFSTPMSVAVVVLATVFLM
ncbi:hypothetical protein PTKIN_Ptkin02bG0154600 [Pterospermum kingtungense]